MEQQRDPSLAWILFGGKKKHEDLAFLAMSVIAVRINFD
jgi:hypothetical protein